jgi:hypothetical protein
VAAVLAGAACAGPEANRSKEATPAGATSAAQEAPIASPRDSTAAAFERLIARARAARWDTLAIGERIGRFARMLEGTPYADGSLEGPGAEVCRITASGFDCVTFMETSLGLARITSRDPAAAAPPRMRDLLDAVTFTRYRDGRINGYTSRLHYTSEWIIENAARGVIEDVTASLGGAPAPPGVGYMSAHPDRYAALASHPDRVVEIREIEARINAHELHFIPKAGVAKIEPELRTGDLIAIATSIAGLDYSHTGLIYKDAEGRARFLHASSAKKRVVLDATLSEYLANGPKSQTGISVLRPLSPARP